MQRQLVLVLIPLLFWSGCESVKPRAQGADNELVVVASFEDREDIQQVLTTIFSDTLTRLSLRPIIAPCGLIRKILMM